MLDPQASRFWQAARQSELIDAEGLASVSRAIPPEKRVAEHLDRRLARQAVQQGAHDLASSAAHGGTVSGFKINRYMLIDMIGQGGMGRVYLAKDTRLNRRVAVEDPLARADEQSPRHRPVPARGAGRAQLQHENLVRIYDEGEANGKCYLVMEYIEGKNIGQMHRRGRPDPSGRPPPGSGGRSRSDWSTPIRKG